MAEAPAKKTRVAPEGEAKVPVTVLTGFLGAGKTTLLNHILHTFHGKKLAVIENEFGEVGVDDALVKRRVQTEDNVIEMMNGCICCTVRGDLIEALKKIHKRNKGNTPFDGVLIETTGLADPGPVAQTFFTDKEVEKLYSLDGIVTLVDAKHIAQHLDEEKPEGVENESVEQIAFADRVLLNKIDLVPDPKQLAKVEERIKEHNSGVEIIRCENSKVDPSRLLGIKAFSLESTLERDDGFLDVDAEHQHDDSVTNVGIRCEGGVDARKFQDWINPILQENGTDIFRSKGRLHVAGDARKYVVQGVHMLLQGEYTEEWEKGEKKENRFCFIGRGLDRKKLTDGFMSCIVKDK